MGEGVSVRCACGMLFSGPCPGAEFAIGECWFCAGTEKPAKVTYTCFLCGATVEEGHVHPDASPLEFAAIESELDFRIARGERP